jgi:hypothetical protein
MTEQCGKLSLKVIHIRNFKDASHLVCSFFGLPLGLRISPAAPGRDPLPEFLRALMDAAAFTIT